MIENKKQMIVKESFFTKIFNKIKRFFMKTDKKRYTTEEIISDDKVKDNEKTKSDFLNSIKVQEDSGLIYLKMKLENNEIRAIDLTDEQIDKLQKIYDKEILEKQNKLNKLKKEQIKKYKIQKISLILFPFYKI